MNDIATMERPITAELLAIAGPQFRGSIMSPITEEEFDYLQTCDAVDASLRVLIVDDYHATTDTLLSLVSLWGHEARRAYDGFTGVNLAAAFLPDVILLDMLPPDISGCEVAVQLRRRVQLQECFIIAISGSTHAKHREQCYEAGVDLFLNKPVPPADLQTLLNLESQYVRRRNSQKTHIRVTANW